MSDMDHELIGQIRDIFARKVKVGCTGCKYCMPCPNGVNIPEIFKVYNDSALISWSEFGKVFYDLVAVSSGRDVSKCTGCKACEKRCPQGIPITGRLKEAHEAMYSTS